MNTDELNVKTGDVLLRCKNDIVFHTSAPFIEVDLTGVCNGLCEVTCITSSFLLCGRVLSAWQGLPPGQTFFAHYLLRLNQH